MGDIRSEPADASVTPPKPRQLQRSRRAVSARNEEGQDLMAPLKTQFMQDRIRCNDKCQPHDGERRIFWQQKERVSQRHERSMEIMMTLMICGSMQKFSQGTLCPKL